MLSESILFNAKKIRKLGSIENGDSASDYHDYEIEHQHSVSLSVLTFEYNEKKINMFELQKNKIDPQKKMRSLLSERLEI